MLLAARAAGSIVIALLLGSLAAAADGGADALIDQGRKLARERDSLAGELVKAKERHDAEKKLVGFYARDYAEKQAALRQQLPGHGCVGELSPLRKQLAAALPGAACAQFHKPNAALECFALSGGPARSYIAAAQAVGEARLVSPSGRTVALGGLAAVAVSTRDRVVTGPNGT